jgi:hypothetical protein
VTIANDLTFSLSTNPYVPQKVLVYKNAEFLNDHRKSVKEEAKEEAKKRSKELLQQAFSEKEGGCDLEDIISDYVVEELSED